MLIVDSVSKKYGDNLALDKFSFKADRGEIIGLFGENGAGKTTLMKSILNLISSEGTVTLDDEKLSHKNIEKIAFATSEHSFFLTLNAKEHFDFYDSHFEKFNKKRFNSLMDFFELPLNKKIKTFSTGQKNQFEVILALSQGADYIFMDEPFAGNDIFNREDFYKLLLGILTDNETIILSTHLIEELRNFIDRAILISKGKLIRDARMSELQDENIELIDFVKRAFSYESDRVSKFTIDMMDMNGESDEQ